MRYTSDQIHAIEAGEKAISPRDMAEQAQLRGDAFRPTYIDDFATHRPLIDKPPRLAIDDAEAATKPKPKPLPGIVYSSDETSQSRRWIAKHFDKSWAGENATKETLVIAKEEEVQA